MSRFPILAAAALFAAVILPTAEAWADEASCDGNACPWLKFDVDACRFTNVGSAAVTVTLQVNGPLGVATLEYKKPLAPGASTAATLGKLCLTPAKIVSYTVNAGDGQGPADAPTGSGVAVQMGFAAGGCSGPRCPSIALTVKDSCLWVTNNAVLPVAVDLQLASGPVHLDMPAAQEVSGEISTDAPAGAQPSGYTPAQCQSARASKQLILSGETAQQDVPQEILDAVAACDQQDQAAAANAAAAPAGPDDPNVATERTYNAMQNQRYEVTSKRVVVAGACVAGPTAVLGYTAN